MLPNSRWSTPVQQYADTALARMVAAYDRKQEGIWALLQDPPKVSASRPRKRKPPVESAPSWSQLLQNHLCSALDDLLRRRQQLDAQITTVRQLMVMER